MEQKFLIFFMAWGLLFGIVAGLMAYILTFLAFRKNFTFGNYPRKAAIQSGVTTFLFFFLLSIMAGLFFPRILNM